MFPLYKSSDFVITVREPSWWTKQTGTAYAFTHPIFGCVIKTLKQSDEHGRYWFRGANPSSVSSRTLGAIDPAMPLYRVLFKISKPTKSLTAS
ncbi:S24/S26 family peptidase [Enterovibrio norvegicus]|uniref:S24/S26 family peptidase n=1 Tax=Enterovibrio norvegicus TaxID=188144 RepID=UPI00352D0BAF